jgi:tRNA(adenine34) deaminase
MDVPIVAFGGEMPSELDLRFMELAISTARAGERTPGGECVGAVLVRDGQAACVGFNEGEMRHDPTAHAEMVVIRRLCEDLSSTSLKGYTIYCTLQPCGMCTMACLWAGISRIVYGAGRDDVHHIYFESRHNNTVDFIQDAFRDDLEIEGGVLAAECSDLYARPTDSVQEKDSPAHEETQIPA